LGTERDLAPILVIGLGNALRGDDAAGGGVMDRIGRRPRADVELLRSRGEATVLLDLWARRALTVVVDAVSGGGAAGDVLVSEPLVTGLPQHLASASSHDFGLAQALRLGRLMGKLPARLFFIGIVGERFGVGDTMSASVRSALDEAASQALLLLEQGTE